MKKSKMDISNQLDNLYFIADDENEERIKTLGPDMAFINCRSDKKARTTRVTFQCEVLGEGIASSEYGHSIYCKIIDQSTIDAYTTLNDRFVSFMEPLEEFEINEMVKNDSIFLKLQQRDGKYKATIIPSCTPANFEKSAVEYGSKLEVTCNIGGYVNFKDKKAGIYLSTSRIVVDGGKKKRK